MRADGEGEDKPDGASADRSALSDVRLHELYREMLLIRRFEEKVEERFRAGELPGFLHVAIGQEAVASGVMAALEPDDVIASTHRAHGHTIAKGTHVNAVMAGDARRKGAPAATAARAPLDLARQSRRERRRRGGLPHHRAALAFQFRSSRRCSRLLGTRTTRHVPRVAQLAQLWKVPEPSFWR